MIKLNTSLSGPDYSFGPGEQVNLDKGFEKRLVKSGQAEYVKTPRKKATKKTTAKKGK